MNSEKLVGQVINSLTLLAALIIVGVLALSAIGKGAAPVIIALVGMGGAAVGSLGTLLANNGMSTNIKGSGAVTVSGAEESGK